MGALLGWGGQSPPPIGFAPKLNLSLPEEIRGRKRRRRGRKRRRRVRTRRGRGRKNRRRKKIRRRSLKFSLGANGCPIGVGGQSPTQ